MEEYLSTRIEVGRLRMLEELALEGLSEKMSRIDEYIREINKYINGSRDEKDGLKKFRDEIIARIGYIVSTFAGLNDPKIDSMIRSKENFLFFADGKRGHLLDNIKGSYKVIKDKIKELDIGVFDDIIKTEKELGN